MSSRPVQRHRQMVRIPSWKQHHRLQWKTTGAAAWQSPRMRKTYPLVFVKWFVQRDHVLKWGLCITAYQNDISKKHQTTTNSQTGRERKGVCPKKRQGSWIALADFKGATSEFNCNVNCQHEESAVWGPSKYPTVACICEDSEAGQHLGQLSSIYVYIYMYIYIYILCLINFNYIEFPENVVMMMMVFARPLIWAPYPTNSCWCLAGAPNLVIRLQCKNAWSHQRTWENLVPLSQMHSVSHKMKSWTLIFWFKNHQL